MKEWYLMDSKKITSIQYAIAIGAIIYCIAPDLIIGPFDDITIAAIATITDIILGVSKSHISIDSQAKSDFDF